MTSRSRLPSRGSQFKRIGMEHASSPSCDVLGDSCLPLSRRSSEPQMPTPRAVWLEEPFPNDPDL
jgi:hypothetical protein